MSASAPRVAIHDETCSCCGSARPRLVSVEPLAGGPVEQLALCDRCLAGEDRAWRLRWQLVEREPVNVSEYRIECL